MYDSVTEGHVTGDSHPETLDGNSQTGLNVMGPNNSHGSHSSGTGVNNGTDPSFTYEREVTTVYSIDISNTQSGSYPPGFTGKSLEKSQYYYSFWYDISKNAVYRLTDRDEPIRIPPVCNANMLNVYFYPNPCGSPLLIHISDEQNTWYVKNCEHNIWEKVNNSKKSKDPSNQDEITQILESAFIPANVLDVSLPTMCYRDVGTQPAFVVEELRVSCSAYSQFRYRKIAGGAFKVVEWTYKGGVLEGIPESGNLVSCSAFYYRNKPLEHHLLLIETVSSDGGYKYFHRSNAGPMWTEAFADGINTRLAGFLLIQTLDDLAHKRGLDPETKPSDVIQNRCRKGLSLDSVITGMCIGIGVAIVTHEVFMLLTEPSKSLTGFLVTLVSKGIKHTFSLIRHPGGGYTILKQ